MPNSPFLWVAKYKARYSLIVVEEGSLLASEHRTNSIFKILFHQDTFSRNISNSPHVLPKETKSWDFNKEQRWIIASSKSELSRVWKTQLHSS